MSESTAAQLILREADRTEFARIFWDHCVRDSRWHADGAAAAGIIPAQLAQHFPDDLNAIAHPFWALLDHLHALLIGYQPELGRAAARSLDESATALTAALSGGDWSGAAAALDALVQQERTRQQRIEQRLIDTADGQLRNQRARQQATQLLNRAMAGKALPADVAAWLQGDWFGELQWCLLQHGDSGSAWQRRADITLALVASLQPPSDENGGRKALYEDIPRVGAGLRTLLAERAVSTAAVEDTLALIEQHHLLLLKGQVPPAAPFKLIAAEAIWYADISLSRDMLARIEALRPGHWFLLRDDEGERRVKLILKQDEVGQLLFVNQLGIKALQVSIEEFAYRLAADMALPLPPLSAGRQALLETLAQLAEQQRSAEQIRRDEEAALERRRAEVRARVEADARQRAEARAKAVAEAKALAEAEAKAVAFAAEQAALAEQQALEREQARRRDAIAAQGIDDTLRQRQARQQVAMLGIGEWIDLHDEKGHLRRLKLAVKLPTSGKLIFVDREGIRGAEFNREQLVDALLDGSAHIAEQASQFEDTLARVVDGLRRDRHWDRRRSETIPASATDATGSADNDISTGSDNNDDG